MKKVNLLISAIALAATLSSCGSDTVIIQNEGGGKAVKEIIAKNFDPEKQVQELEIKAKEELYGELGEIKIVYWEGEKQMEHVYSVEKGLQAPKETFASERKMNFQLQKTKTMAVKEFDVEPIPNKVNEAILLLPKESDTHNLYEYSFSFDKDGKAKQNFKINVTKKGEGKTQTGRMVRTNYYEFNFAVDERGKVVAVETP
ncbi:hypothetical protein [Pedobacter agri]|uniref:hypothetical protein n=1 Tax=Pedobacter agri TaxID=454586 RepID=UPI002930C2E3|nr:hypothetical protein [Pedobacter agri]